MPRSPSVPGIARQAHSTSVSSEFLKRVRTRPTHCRVALYRLSKESQADLYFILSEQEIGKIHLFHMPPPHTHHLKYKSKKQRKEQSLGLLPPQTLKSRGSLRKWRRANKTLRRLLSVQVVRSGVRLEFVWCHLRHRDTLGRRPV